MIYLENPEQLTEKRLGQLNKLIQYETSMQKIMSWIYNSNSLLASVHIFFICIMLF